MIKKLDNDNELIAFEVAEKWSENDDVEFVSFTVDFINRKMNTVLTVEFFDDREEIIELSFEKKIDYKKYEGCDKYFWFMDLDDLTKNHDESIIETFLMGW